MLAALNYTRTPTSRQLLNFLFEIDRSFEPAISSRLNLESYTAKLFDNAEILAYLDSSKTKIVGAIILYCNDKAKQNAYIPIVAVLPDFRGHGITKNLFNRVYDLLREKSFKFLSLETWFGGDALAYYIKTGFYIEETSRDRPNGGVSIKMKKDLSLYPEHFKFLPTPVRRLKKIGKEYDIEIFVKHDDLFVLPGGGSKARKLQYILKKAIAQGCDAVVTAGGAQSNHVRATAIMAASLGIKTKAIIHSEEPLTYEGNLKLLSLAGADIHFVNMEKVKATMDLEVNHLIEQGYKPFYIWGGGHSVEGSFSYYEAVLELKEQIGELEPDFIIVPSGTGSTQAGIEVGVRKFFENCKVLGVSVAREEQRGTKVVIESANELESALGLEALTTDVFFDDTKMGQGYEDTFPALEECIKEAAVEEGLLLDPTYSGKAFYGLKTYMQNGLIPSGSKVVFWHTGGIMNLMTSNI